MKLWIKILVVLLLLACLVSGFLFFLRQDQPSFPQATYFLLNNQQVSVGYSQIASDNITAQFIGQLLHVYSKGQQVYADILLSPNTSPVSVLLSSDTNVPFQLIKQATYSLYPTKDQVRTLSVSASNVGSVAGQIEGHTILFTLLLAVPPYPSNKQLTPIQQHYLAFLDSVLTCNQSFIHLLQARTLKTLTCVPYIHQMNVYEPTF